VEVSAGVALTAATRAAAVAAIAECAAQLSAIRRASGNAAAAAAFGVVIAKQQVALSFSAVRIAATAVAGMTQEYANWDLWLTFL
jgi:hypothetical protein